MKRRKLFLSGILALALLLCGCNNTDGGNENTDTERENQMDIITESPELTGTETAEADVAPTEAEISGYVVVTDYITPEKDKDCSAEINKLILESPNRTIYFPDGDYYISSPILTPADPKKSVDLRLSNYAHIIAIASEWKSGVSMIKLGGVYPYNDTATPGSNYSLTGGIIDGNGVAGGIAIMSGRETKVTDVSIKSVHTGLYIAYGANSGSSDCDIFNLSITGCGQKNDVGILIEGYDNTLTNIRISKVNTGVRLKSQANFMRNIHPLYCSDFSDYTGSVGFLDESGANFYDNCYSDQFETGFETRSVTASRYTDCFVFWWTDAGDRQIAFKATGVFNSVVNGITAGFKSKTKNSLLVVSQDGGNGVIRDAAFNESIVSDKTYQQYLEGTVFHYGW